MIDKISDDNPGLGEQLRRNLSYASTGEGPRVRGHVRGERFVPESTNFPDGSFIRPTEEADRSIEKILERSGVGREEIDHALDVFEIAPDSRRISIGHGVEAIKWPIERIELDLSRSSPINPMLPIKIAFEYIALCVGDQIYSDAQPLSDLRRVLLEGPPLDSEIVNVERYASDQYQPLHGICIEDNRQHARIQIRLFGSIVYIVEFFRLRIADPRFAYTHCLLTGEEDCRVIS